MDCERTATHKLQAKDGGTIYVCDEHLKEWRYCTEIPPFKTRIVKNKFKLAFIAFCVATIVFGIIFYYNSLA